MMFVRFEIRDDIYFKWREHLLKKYRVIAKGGYASIMRYNTALFEDAIRREIEDE